MIAFLAAAALLTVTPGPDTAIVLRNAAAGGRTAGAAAALGVMVGLFAWAAAASGGVAAVMLASKLSLRLFAGLGAAYLIWIGAPLLLRPRSVFAAGGEGAATPAAAFRKGLFTNLLNPKVGLFYMTFLPQFIPRGADPLMTGLGLAAAHVAMTGVWFAVLIGLSAAASALLRRKTVLTILDRATGCVLLVFAARLAAAAVAGS